MTEETKRARIRGVVSETVPEKEFFFYEYGERKEAPITLEDIMLTAQRKRVDAMYFNVCVDGGFYQVKYDWPDGNECVVLHENLGLGQWAFGKPFSAQSVKVVNLLYKLLVK